MIGTVAVTDGGWYEFLLQRPHIQEVNFWRPSARRAFRAPAFSPFLFKLRAPDSAICGFGFHAVYSALPVWLAWEAFEEGNGCGSLAEMNERVARIRRRIRYRPDEYSGYIGCTTIVHPTFFPKELWVAQPADWRPRTQTDRKYDLEAGEGRKVWDACLAAARQLPQAQAWERGVESMIEQPRYGEPVLIRPRLGQKTFQIAVLDAYERACAVTAEHSLPALDAAHVQPFSLGGPHSVTNGLLLRADLHRLFDRGYVTVTPEMRLEVSSRLRAEYRNGKTYYPLHGSKVRGPRGGQGPDPELLRWHNENLFAA